MGTSPPQSSELDVAIREILSQSSSALGEDFFSTITCELARVLGADCAMIGILNDGRSDQVKSLALCLDGELVDNVLYDLPGTPCEHVVGCGIEYFPHNVKELFPQDTMLLELRIEGYVGIPLFDSGNKALGIMVALYREEVPDPEFVSTVMHVFASRTAAEIERLELESRRRDLETKMQHAQKLESLGVLAGGIAHDFNNLLCSIMGSAELALLSTSKDDPASENLHTIMDASHQAARLCRQLLSYSGKARLEKKPLDLPELCQKMKHLLEVSVANRADFKRTLPKDLPTIEGDPAQIQQVVFNLVVNAAEAIGSGGGEIELAVQRRYCRPQDLRSPYLKFDFEPGEFLVLEVSDTGSGMDREALTKLFDPFFTTKFTGRGLGLSAILGIVRSHQASIQVESKPSVGTKVSVFFPVSGRLPTPPASCQPALVLNERILLIDDDDSVRSVTKGMLEKIGLTVTSAADGRAGIAEFSADPSAIDVVLCDLSMPDLGGEEVFAALREIKPDVRVVMMSGYSKTSSTTSLVETGLSAFVQKPLSLSVLSETLSKALGH